MKKILIVFSISLFSFVSLGACGSENGKETSSSVKQSEEMKNTEDNIAQFENIVEEYFEKQQKLMLKQSEIEKTETDIEGVGNFEELSKHAQDVINSKEYKDWVTVSKKVETFKLEKTEESERYIEAQKALTKYNEIQNEYFQGVSSAKSVDEYNEVVSKIQEPLSESQEELQKVWDEAE